MEQNSFKHCRNLMAIYTAILMSKLIDLVKWPNSTIGGGSGNFWRWCCDDKWNQNLMLAGPLSQQPPRSRWGRFLCNFPAVANLAPCPRFPFVLPSRLGPSVQVPSNILNLDIIKGCALKGLLDWTGPLKASNQTICFWTTHKQYILALHNPFLFSLEPSHKFHIQRKTTNMGVTFYVKDNFRLKPLNWFWKHAFFSHGWGFKEKCHSFGIFVVVDLFILLVFLDIFDGACSSGLSTLEVCGSLRDRLRKNTYSISGFLLVLTWTPKTENHCH